MNLVYFLLGSNLEFPLEQLSTAIKIIEQEIGRIEVSSSIYKTAAWGNQDQPDFYNQVIKVQSQFSAEACMQKALAIEAKMGRQRQEKYGPRTIDIDILLYNGLIMDSPDLIIPHPEMCHRRFTLVPLCEIAPDMKHPILGATMQELLTSCADVLPVDKI